MSYQSEVLADAPVGYWRLDDAIGSTSFADASGNSRAATVSGSIGFGQGPAKPGIGGASVRFTGTQKGEIAAASNGFIAGKATFSIEAWFRSTDTSDNHTLFSVYDSSRGFTDARNWAQVRIDTTGNIRFTIGRASGNGELVTSGNYLDGAWHHLVAVRGADATMRVYIDGTQIGSLASSGTPNSGAGQVVRLGSGDNNGALYGPHSGRLDEVAVYDYALSAARISAHYAAAGVAPVTSNYSTEVLADTPLMYWRLDEATGTTAADSSGNSRAGTITSMNQDVQGATLGNAGMAATGSASRVLIPGASWMDTPTWTVEAWARFTSADTGRIVSREAKPGQTVATDYIWSMQVANSGRMQAVVFNSGGAMFYQNTTQIGNGAWHHCVITWDGTTIRTYIDGVAGLTGTPGAIQRNAATDIVAANARATNDGGTPYSGVADMAVDEVAYYGTALSPARIAAHYAAANSTAAPPKTGTASGAFSFAGSATGKRVTAGVAAGALAFAGVAVGSAPVKGSAVGSIAYVGAAAGVAPVVGPRTGSAAGSFAFTGAATGSSPVKGNGSGAFSFTGAAAGVTPAVGMKFGTAAGAFSWAGAASGAPANRAGSATGGFSFVGTAAGTNTAIPMGAATGTILWRGVAFGANGTTTIPGWDVDDSGQTTLGLGGSGELDVMPPLALPPEGYAERTLIRRSVVVPALHTIPGRIVDPVTGGIRIPDDVYDALPLATGDDVEQVGVPHILFPNFGDLNDVTYFRGGIIRIGNMRMEEPFGDVTLSIEIPLLTSMDPEPNPDNPDDPLYWTMNRANVEIVLRHPDGTVTRLWAGHIISHDIGNDSSGAFRRLTAVGSLRQAATDVLKVPNMLDPTDIGTLIPRALNGVASRRYPKIGWVSTGIMSRQRGSWSDSPLGYTQSLLSTSFTPAGNQWTVSKVEGTRRTYELRPKDTVPTLTVTNGARGVEVDLTRDATSTRNVIYGHGVADNGYAWWNYKYPNLSGDTAPLYPGSLMGLGASGAGVSLWQQRVKDLGYSISVDGTISSSDVLIIKTVQRRFGVQVDGVIGPQTWAATFDVGGNGGDLSGVIRLPLAADPRTQPFLYNADGSVAGDNPDFDRNVIIYADDVDFGSGITRAEGIQSAQQILERESEPGLTGRIVLNSDPREMSRFLIRPGRKIKLVGFERADRVLHITAVDIDWQSLSVTLEVDEKSRDAMTVAQIRERDKEARRDPARRPGNANRRSRLDVDQVVPFDGESGAGRIPKFATYGGLWSVIRIPVSETGRVAIVDMQTTAPTSQLFVAMFGAPIQPAHLVKYVGNPSSTSARWEQNREVLEDTFGWIEAFGSPDEPGGYWPGLKSNNSPLTGRLKDTGGFEYVSAKPPWVWVAVWTPVSSYVSGRVLPAPVI